MALPGAETDSNITCCLTYWTLYIIAGVNGLWVCSVTIREPLKIFYWCRTLLSYTHNIPTSCRCIVLYIALLVLGAQNRSHCLCVLIFIHVYMDMIKLLALPVLPGNTKCIASKFIVSFRIITIGSCLGSRNPLRVLSSSVRHKSWASTRLRSSAQKLLLMVRRVWIEKRKWHLRYFHARHFFPTKTSPHVFVWGSSRNALAFSLGKVENFQTFLKSLSFQNSIKWHQELF